MDEFDDVLNELSLAQIDEIRYEFELWQLGFYRDKQELQANVHCLIMVFQGENRSH